jgi:putative transposase
MLLYEYKLRHSRAQAAASDAAIRTTQFMRNKCVRHWMDGHGARANDLQALCSRLAQEDPFAAALHSQPAKPPPPAPGPRRGRVGAASGLRLGRNQNAAKALLRHGMVVARVEGRWPRLRSETSEPKGTVGHTGTETLGDSRAPADG